MKKRGPSKKQRRKLRAEAQKEVGTLDLDRYRKGLTRLRAAEILEKFHNTGLVHVETRKRVLDAIVDRDPLLIHVNARAAVEFLSTLRPFWVQNDSAIMKPKQLRDIWIAMHFFAQTEGDIGVADLRPDSDKLRYALSAIQPYDLRNPVRDTKDPDILWFHPNEEIRAFFQKAYEIQRADPSSPYFEGPVK